MSQSNANSSFEPQKTRPPRVDPYLIQTTDELIKNLKIRTIDESRIRSLVLSERRVNIDFIPFGDLDCWKLLNSKYEERIALQELLSLLNILDDAESDPPSITGALLNGLQTFASQIHSLGLHAESFILCEFENRVLEYCAKEYPKLFTYHYAASLHRLAGRLLHQHRTKEALQAVDKSVTLFNNPLGDDQSVARRSGLASALQLRGSILNELGYFMDSIPNLEQSVLFHREMSSQTSYKIYRLPTLPVALLELSSALHRKQEYKTAFEYANEALGLLHTINENELDGQCYLKFKSAPFEARAYACAAQAQIQFADKDAQKNALDSAKKALEILKPQIENQGFEKSMAINHDYMNYLRIAGTCHLSTEDAETDGRALFLEAIEARRMSLKEYPGWRETYLADDLEAFADALRKSSKHEEAIVLLGEALQIHRHVHQEYSHFSQPATAACLENLARRLADMGVNERAYLYSQEALLLYYKIMNTYPVASYNIFRRLFNQHIQLYKKMKSPEDALAYIIQRTSGDQDESQHGLALACYLHEKAQIHIDLTQWELAMLAQTEAARYLETYIDNYPEVVNVGLSQARYICATAAFECKHILKAIENVEKAIDIQRKLNLKEELEKSLALLASCLVYTDLLIGDSEVPLDNYRRAAEVLKEAIEISREISQHNITKVTVYINNILCLSSVYHRWGRAIRDNEEQWKALSAAVNWVHQAASYEEEHPEQINRALREKIREQKRKCFAKTYSMSGNEIQKVNREERKDVDTN